MSHSRSNKVFKITKIPDPGWHVIGRWAEDGMAFGENPSQVIDMSEIDAMFADGIFFATPDSQADPETNIAGYSVEDLTEIELGE